MAKSKEKKEEYSIKLHMNGVDYVGTGESIDDAIKSLSVDYTKVKTKGELTIQLGEQRHTRVVPLPKLRRYFASKILMGGLIRDLGILLR